MRVCKSVVKSHLSLIGGEPVRGDKENEGREIQLMQAALRLPDSIFLILAVNANRPVEV